MDGAEKAEGKVKARLTVKLGPLEVSFEGSVGELLSEIDLMGQLVERLSEKFSMKPFKPAFEEAEGYPVIKPAKSTMENLQAIFNTQWGATPRSLSEVTKALEVNGVPDSPSNITVYLKRLVNRGFLRRILKDGKYFYYKVPETAG